MPAFDEFLKSYTTTLDDGVLTDAVSKGDGMQRALMLAIIKAHADMRRAESLGRAFIFFIDEAELHLHPSAQRQLKNALLSLAEGVDQVFITSHSSVFLSDLAPEQSSFLIEKENGATSAELLTKNKRGRAVFELLGGSPADLLLPANLLIAEGPSEVEFLNIVIERFYSHKPSIQIVAAGGDDHRQAVYLKDVNKIFSVVDTSPIYKKQAILLLDKPNGGDKEKRLAAFLDDHPYLKRNNQVFTLPVETLEEYYPDKYKTESTNKNRKVKLAKQIGNDISEDDFTKHMIVVYNAFMACFEKAY